MLAAPESVMGFEGLGAGGGGGGGWGRGVDRVALWCLKCKQCFLSEFFCIVKDEGLVYELLEMKRVQFLFILALRV